MTNIQMTPPSTESNLTQHIIQENSQTVCMFCSADPKEVDLSRSVIYEDDAFIAKHHVDQNGRSLLGLIMIWTKRHVHDLGEMSETEAEQLGALIRRVSIALKSTTNAPWTYCYCFMEGVRHVHVFIAARYANLPEKYMRLNIGEWPNAPTGNYNEVEALSSKLRNLLLSSTTK